MIRPTRLGAAATIAALGVSMATPVIDSASAATNPLSLPAGSQLTTALGTLMSTPNATNLLSELQNLQANGATSGVVTSLDATLENLVSGLSSILGPITNPNQLLESTINATSGLLPVGATAAQQQAVSELTAALTSAGLGSLLAGLSSDNGAGALTQLAALANLVPGASTPAGGLTSVGAIVAQLASEVGSGSSATALTNAAGLLDSSSALTPAQLETAIADLSSVTSGVPSGTSGVTVAQAAQALASQLSQSGSLLGGLASVGSTLSALTDSSAISSALGQLGSLSSLAPNANSPLSGVAAVLTAIAATPGVSGTPAATTLDSVAATLSDPNGVSATDLLGAITSLQGVASSLPAPLSTVASEIISALSDSGSVLGTLPGLSSADVATLLAELTQLGSLSSGAQIDSLPGLAAVLTQIGATSPIAGTPAQTVLDNLASAIETNPLTGAGLGVISSVLDQVSASLPAPLSTTVSDLGGLLSSDANTVSGTTGTTGTTGSTGASGTSGTSGTSGSGSTGATGASSATGASGTSGVGTSSSTSSGTVTGTGAGTTPFYDWGFYRSETRTLHAVKVTLFCYAHPGTFCNDTIKVTEKGYHAATKKVRFRSDKTDHWTLNLKAIPTKTKTKTQTKTKKVRKATGRPVMKLTITSLNYKVTKTLK